MRFIKAITVLLLVGSITILIGGCSFGADPIQDVVVRMYESLEIGDTNAYMDTLLPENRRQPNPFGLLNALSASAGFGGLNLGVDISKLIQVSFSDLEVTVLAKKGDYALTQAMGKIRYPILMMETPFCEQLDLRRVDGKWYVDLLALERQQRMARILQRQQAQLEQLGLAAPAETGDIGADLQNMFGMFGSSMEYALNLCE